MFWCCCRDAVPFPDRHCRRAVVPCRTPRHRWLSDLVMNWQGTLVVDRALSPPPMTSPVSGWPAAVRETARTSTNVEYCAHHGTSRCITASLRCYQANIIMFRLYRKLTIPITRRVVVDPFIRSLNLAFAVFFQGGLSESSSEKSMRDYIQRICINTTWRSSSSSSCKCVREIQSVAVRICFVPILPYLDIFQVEISRSMPNQGESGEDLTTVLQGNMCENLEPRV